MATSIMDRGEIVTQGLEMGGNPSITILANNFLNLFLDALSRAKDFEELVKEASISVSSGSEEASLAAVTDYRAIREVHLNGDTLPLLQENYPRLWRLIRVAKEASNTGDPTSFAVDPGGTKLVVYPVAQSDEVGKILYYSVPAKLTDNAHVPFYPDAHTLVNAVADFGATYERDTLQQVIARNVEVALSKSLMGIGDQGRSRMQTMRFDSTVYGVWRGDN